MNVAGTTIPVSQAANPVSVTPLTRAVPVANLAGAASSWLYFSLDVPAGATNLQFTISGGSGDADLYVRFGSLPTLADYDCRPYIGGNTETCAQATQAGTWYVGLQAYSTFSGVTLVGNYDLPDTGFYPLTPCRIIDTRNATGPYGGPVLPAQNSRTVTVAGASCGIPVDATAIAVNLTAVSPSTAGALKLIPAGTSPTAATALNFRPGRTDGNNAIAKLGTGGAVVVFAEMPSGTTHFVLDVSGYFK